VALTDDELFDFDKHELVGWDPAHVERTLAEHRDAYRAQLVAARWIEQWAKRLAESNSPAGRSLSEERLQGYTDARLEVVAYLRQGDLAPGGRLHDDTDEGRL
jgi:hypothetical protein